MRTDHVAGFVVERGPNTAQVKAPMRRFLERARPRGAPCSRRGRRAACGTCSATAAWCACRPRRSACSPRRCSRARGKLRVFAEPFVRRGDGQAESVAEFVSRRAGHEVVQRPGRAVPHRSLRGRRVAARRRGGLRRRRRARAPLWLARARQARRLCCRGAASEGLRGTWSGQHGFGPLARQLTNQLVEPPALGSRVSSASRATATRWRIDIAAPTRRHGAARARRGARHAGAGRGRGAARRRRRGRVGAAGHRATRRSCRWRSASQPEDARARIQGFGFLVPREEPLRLLGCLFMSQLFPGRAPEGSRALAVHARRRALARGRRAARRRAARRAARRPRALARLPRRAAWCSVWRAGRARSRSPAATTPRACASRAQRAAGAGSRWRAPT